jgi:hypothetical protein
VQRCTSKALLSTRCSGPEYPKTACPRGSSKPTDQLSALRPAATLQKLCPQSHLQQQQQHLNRCLFNVHSSGLHASVSASTACYQPSSKEHAAESGMPQVAQWQASQPAPPPGEASYSQLSAIWACLPGKPASRSMVGDQVGAQRTMAPAEPASPCITPARICAATSDTPDGVCGRKMVLERPFAPTSCTGDNAEHII